MAESTSGWQGSHIGADWAQRVNSCHVSKAMMNKLVMDFLVIEGHKEAAECFQAESGTTAGLDLETISDRRTIRSAIESGDVQRAVAHAHKLSPDLLTGSPELSFHVEQQQLVVWLLPGLDDLRVRRRSNAEHHARHTVDWPR